MQLIPASANARIVSFLLSAIAGVACGGSTIAEISGDAGSGGNDGGTTSRLLQKYFELIYTTIDIEARV